MKNTVKILSLFVCLYTCCEASDCWKILAKERESHRTLVDQLNRRISSLNGDITKIRNRFEGVCKIFYKEKCYVPVLNKPVSLAQARDICAGMSGKIADIYDLTHLDVIMKGVREHYMLGLKYLGLMTGMTTKPSTGQVFFSDGTEITYLPKWHPRNPSKNSGFTTIIINVKELATDVSQYLYNHNPTVSIYHHALCEI